MVVVGGQEAAKCVRGRLARSARQGLRDGNLKVTSEYGSSEVDTVLEHRVKANDDHRDSSRGGDERERLRAASSDKRSPVRSGNHVTRAAAITSRAQRAK